MKILTLTLLLFFVLNASAGETCAIQGKRTVMDDAMDEIHAALNGENDRPEQVVEKWLGEIALELEKPAKPSATTLHAAVDLGRQLVQLGRRDEARRFFERVAGLDRDGEWGRKAAGHIRSMGGK